MIQEKVGAGSAEDDALRAKYDDLRKRVAAFSQIVKDLKEASDEDQGARVCEIIAGGEALLREVIDAQMCVRERGLYAVEGQLNTIVDLLTTTLSALDIIAKANKADELLTM